MKKLKQHSFLFIAIYFFCLTFCIHAKENFWQNKYLMPIVDASTIDLEKAKIDFVAIAKTELIPQLDDLEKALRAKNFSNYVKLMEKKYQPESFRRITGKRKGFTKEKLLSALEEAVKNSPKSQIHGLFNLPEDFWSGRKWEINCWSWPTPKKENIRFIVSLITKNDPKYPEIEYSFAFKFGYENGLLKIIDEDFGYGELVPFHSSQPESQR